MKILRQNENHHLIDSNNKPYSRTNITLTCYTYYALAGRTLGSEQHLHTQKKQLSDQIRRTYNVLHIIFYAK